MTITINDDCESVTIDSIYFDTDNQAISLTVKLNCTNEYLVPVEVSDTEIIVDVDALDLGDLAALPDGVYYFELNITQEDGTKIAESGCKFVNCGTNCLMLDTFTLASTGDEEAIIKSLAYHALIASQGCIDCNCTDMCTLYNATQLTNCTNVTTNCGCS